MKDKKKLLCFSIAMSIGAISPSYATLIDTGFVSPQNSAIQNSGAGQMHVGFSGGNGTFEVNSSSVGNGFTTATATGLIIGNEGTTGTVRVIGNGISGSAQINITNGFGLRNSLGGTGILEIKSGGVINSNKQEIFLGNQGLSGTAGTATTLIDGTGSILRSQQGSTGPNAFDVAGGRIYIGFDGQSNSTVNITNGGLMESLSDSNAQRIDGSILIGQGDSGSIATVNVSGIGSTMKADTWIDVSANGNSSSTLNISNGGHVEVTNSANFGAEMSISTITGTAGVTVNSSSLSAEDIAIGGTALVAGFTASGVPVSSPDFSSLVVGQQVSDVNGNLLFDRAGNPVVAVNQVFPGGFTAVVPETFITGNEIYVKQSGSLIVENFATVNAQTIEVSDNSQPTALPFNGQVATLTIQSGSTVIADVNVNKDGVLNGNGGTIVGNVIINGGTVAPGFSPGTLTVNGDLTLNSGLLEVEIVSATVFDILHITGDLFATNGFDLDISFLNGFLPQDGDVFDFLQVDGVSNLDLTLVNIISDASTNGFSFALNFQGGILSVVSTSAVPIPAAVWLFGTGIIGLFGASRRRVN